MTRIAIVNKDKCRPHECGGYFCMRICPRNRAGDECIVVSEDKKVNIDEALCIGCGICPKKCPFGALDIINLPEELDHPIHRYGDNGFSLYNLPVPLFGKVVGILGRNGIGKSTAVMILAGILKPNFGEKGKEVDYKELIEHFKGTEAQIFFEKLQKGSIKVAYKPQQVDQIPKEFKGTVKELLEKADALGNQKVSGALETQSVSNEKKKLKSIAKTLELDAIMDHDISKISGGELQRVAIAATVLKDANVYFFDEPTSYLDIKQRLKISKFLRDLATEDTAVMVVEHDLIILDYMTDLIHMMYGKSACYGIVSQVKTTKAGINIYLSGFLREENMRFRDYAIQFLARPKDESSSGEEITHWDKFEHDFGSFHLKAEEGKIDRKDVIGILGENGIGKTSFVKILAGDILTPHSIKDLKISYKPQYLEKNKEMVITYLHDALKYELQIVRPLGLKKLFEKRMDELSGGELQAVAIAHCLAKTADLYLLDEPSAYLDVEQRLVASKVIREMMADKGKSALVVDHDLLFIDYLSKKLLVFDGKPAVKGTVKGPFTMEEGMNHFLKDLGITFRRDEESNRPRVNKLESVKDREQKSKGKLYYS
ncbi:MAG: ribosome biogenesis/translation initiation ATPase RLI [archaeon]